MRIRVGHLYPDYLNIYADRGNIAVLAERARAARARARRARDRARRRGARRRHRPLLRRRRPGPRAGARRARSRRQGARPLREAVEGGAAFLAVCGGYQLLGRFYRDVAGDGAARRSACCRCTRSPASARMIGDVLLDCAWAGQTLAGFENHAGRTILDEGAEPLGRVVAGFGNDGASRLRGLPPAARLRDVPPRPAAAAQPVVRRPAARRGARPRRRARPSSRRSTTSSSTRRTPCLAERARTRRGGERGTRHGPH